MSVNATDIQEGRCFVTSKGQMRKVVKVENGKVTYESWSANQSRPSNPHRSTSGLATFAESVDGEVGCDFNLGVEQTKNREI